MKITFTNMETANATLTNNVDYFDIRNPKIDITAKTTKVIKDTVYIEIDYVTSLNTVMAGSVANLPVVEKGTFHKTAKIEVYFDGEVPTEIEVSPRFIGNTNWYREGDFKATIVA